MRRCVVGVDVSVVIVFICYFIAITFAPTCPLSLSQPMCRVVMCRVSFFFIFSFTMDVVVHNFI